MEIFKTKEGYINIYKSERNFELLMSKIISEFVCSTTLGDEEDLEQYFRTVKSSTYPNEVELKIGLTDIFEDIGDNYHFEFVNFLTQTLELENCEEILDLDYLNLRKVAL